jgi:hypothetical protein
MRSAFLSTALAVGVMGLACGTAEAAVERAVVGSVDKVQARADAVHEAAIRPLAAQGDVLFDDLLRTGPGARLQATLGDGTALTLGENGEMLVDEFVYAPGQDGNRLALKVVSGAFLFVGGKVEDGAGGAVTIATPVATLGVRGTTVWGGMLDGVYTVLVLDGEVEVSTPRGSVTLQAGEATLIPGRAGAPVPPHPLGEDKTARAVATISFAD